MGDRAIGGGGDIVGERSKVGERAIVGERLKWERGL